MRWCDEREEWERRKKEKAKNADEQSDKKRNWEKT